MQNLKKRFLIYIVLIVGGLYIYQKREVLISAITVVVYAGLLTLILSPVCQRLEKKGMPISAAAIISICLLIGLLTLVLAVFVPYMISHTADLIGRSGESVSALIAKALELSERFGLRQWYRQEFSGQAGKWIANITAFFAHAGIAFAAQTGRLVFSLAISFYFLRDRKRLCSQLLLCLPLRWRTSFLHMINGCKSAVLGYLSGMIKTSVIITLLTYIGLFLVGIPDALLLSLFMGIFEFLPYIGPVLASIPILLSAVPFGLHTALITLMLIVVVQQIESNIISPYFTASSTSIQPLTCLISVFLFGSLFGIWGVLLAIPIVITVKSISWSIRQESMI